jgi:uncharacterized membrane protein
MPSYLLYSLFKFIFTVIDSVVLLCTVIIWDIFAAIVEARTFYIVRIWPKRAKPFNFFKNLRLCNRYFESYLQLSVLYYKVKRKRNLLVMEMRVLYRRG